MRQSPHELVLKVREENLHLVGLRFDKARRMREGTAILMTDSSAFHAGRPPMRGGKGGDIHAT
jgi:hypothetical protein